MCLYLYLYLTKHLPTCACASCLHAAAATQASKLCSSRQVHSPLAAVSEAHSRGRISVWPCAAEVVSERVRRQIAERQAALAAAEAAPEMSGRAAAELKRALAAELRPGETVTAALRRLRPAPARPAGKRGALHAAHDLPAPSGVSRMARLTIC